MAIPTSKPELQSAIIAHYAKFRTAVLTVPETMVRQKDMEGHAKGTTMSINDLLAYLIGWGELVLKWIDKKEKNEKTDFPETGYKWNELGLLAQKFYQDYQQCNFQTLLHQLNTTVDRILQVIEKKTNKELYETPWYEKWTMGRMIQLNTSSPYQNAKGRINKWKKQHNL